MPNLSLPSDAFGLFVYIVGLIVLWILVSIPVYFAGRALKGKTTSFGSAMGATLGGVLAYYIVFFLADFFLGAIAGVPASALATLLAVLVWLAVYRAAFDTGWLGAIAIVFIAWVILLIIDFFLLAIFGVKFPDFFPF